MTAIPLDMTLTDRRGVAWHTAPAYQDHDTSAPGWLLLRSATGEELPFGDLIRRYGFPDEAGAPYLIAAPNTHFVYGATADYAEIKLLNDGWAWRCWACGWLGIGLVSAEGARREMAQHECHPAGDRLRMVPADPRPAQEPS